MTDEQIRRWASQGIEFGAHTRTHPHLMSLDESAIRTEVEGSAQLLGTSAASVACPFGEYNETALQCAQKAFDLAFSCDEGLNHLTTRRHRPPRTKVSPSDTLPDFWAPDRLGYGPVRNLHARLGIRTGLQRAPRSIFRRSKP
jgi:peptidoglycan/xylan/chitin deacetylase (PgdA/CDA1 family)